MTEIARIRHIFRYPVKSMAGEALTSAELGWHGIRGDRRYSFVRSGNISDFPWLTASKIPDLVRYQAYHHAGEDPSRPAVRVRTPEGEDLEVGHESLRLKLAAAFGKDVSLMRIGNGIFDDSPLSLLSTTTVDKIASESGCAVDARRFRPNILVEPVDGAPVHETDWVGKTLVFGTRPDAPSIRVTIHDIRCVMVNISPDTAESDPRVLKTLGGSFNGCAGVYGVVLTAGILSVGDRLYFGA